MRNSILKRFATGFMAVAMIAGMFFGMSLSAAPAADVIPSGVTYGGMTITGITVDGTAVTAYTGDTATGVIEIPVAATLAAGKTITVTATITPTLGSYIATVDGTEVLDITGAAGGALTTAVTNNYTVPSLTTQPKVSDLAAKKTVTFTLTTAAITAPDSVFLEIATTEAAYAATETAFAFWSTGVVDRRVIPAANVDTIAKTIVINYSSTADSSLLKFTGDTLPTITIAKAKTLTTFTGLVATDYNTAVINKAGNITLGADTYAVTFTTEPIAQLNGTTWANSTLKTAMGYSVAVTVGGATYTVDKASTTGFTFPAGTALTFNKVTTNTGAATVTFKGAYLFADQSFSATSAELTAGKTFTIVYKDGTTSTVTVAANATGVTASSAGITATPPTVAVLVSGAATTYPNTTTSVAGLTTVAVNLVNDLIPATLQVKLTSTFIAGGSKTVEVDFYNQVFPIELTDGSYYYLSVNVSSLKNALLPVSKFDFIGVASLNNDFLPLTTWNTTDPNMNKTLLIDATGVLTDRVTYAGVLADGTTAKIWPSTSYYQPNAGYDAAYWFYARWTVGGTMYGASVKYTRPYVTFDVTDATTNTVCTYSAVFIIAKQEMYATAINSTLGGQASVSPIVLLDDSITKDAVAKTEFTGEYSQTWKQADTYSQYVKNVTTTRKGKIKITSYYAGTVDLAADYVVLTLRLPKGCTITMPTTATGDISGFTVLQSFNGVAGNTTTDGLVDYIVKFQYRELFTGSNTVGASTLKVSYPLTNKDNTTLSTTAFKEYAVVTTWVAKAYIAEKKVTMAGITIPNAIVAPSEVATSSVAASSTAASSTATSSTAATSSTIPVNPNTGVPFNTLAYIVTIAASAVGGVSTMVLRRK